MEISSPGTFDESVVSSGVDNARLPLSLELLDDLGSLEDESSPSDGSSDGFGSSSGGSLSDHSNSRPLSVSSGVDGVSVALQVESLDNLFLPVPADILGVLSFSEGPAFFSTSSEALDGFGTLHGSGPLASGESSESSLVGDASLSLSQELSDNLGSLEQEFTLWSESPWSSADNSLRSSSSKDNASFVSFSESLDDGSLG